MKHFLDEAQEQFEAEIVNKPEPTFGKQLVGWTFNPSGDDKVARAKQLCAELADLIFEHQREKGFSGMGYFIYDKAMAEILTAQMYSVKFLTFKP